MPAGVRPTEARVREALFSIWAGRIRGARFLDLFAGSGAVGLEASRRGADEVVFVEARRRVAAVLEANAAPLVETGWRVLVAELPGGLARALGRSGDARFDLAFADPPYTFERYEGLVAEAAGALAPSGVLAVEHAARATLPVAAGGLALDDRRRYGDTRLSIYGLRA